MPSTVVKLKTATCRHTSFLNTIKVTQEPRADISRFLLAADEALQQKGITLSLATFEDLHDIYDRNRDSWPILLPFFDAAIEPIDPDTAACFIAFNDAGDPIATTAVRVWDLKGTSLKAEIESLRFFFGGQAAAWRNRAVCDVSAPIAAGLDGRALYCGGYWIHPDYRGQGLTQLVPAISRFYALGRWAIDYKVSLGGRVFLSPEMRQLYQYEAYEEGVTYTVDDDVRLKNVLLMWARTSFMLDELPALTSALKPAERSTLHRHA
jgi:GNAT superfamily N-acetyltransferase